MRFEDQVVLVTGGTGGIGRALCQRFAEEGADVVVHTHARPKDANAVVDGLADGDHTAVQTDLADATSVKRMIDGVVEARGRLDVLVNNAGIYEEHPLDATPYDAWQAVWSRTLAVNLVGPANACYAAARAMREAGRGAIVNVSSRGAFRGEPRAPAYGASKAGLNALTQSLAQALAPWGISVTAVAPGFVDTPMVTDLLEGERGDTIRSQSPAGRVARPEEVAAVVAFLASGEAPFTTGTIVDVNGASYLRT